MIKYIRRGDLDVEKYDSCIKDSINTRIYAYSWYLDIVADNWDALVLGDYKYVMPLPWRSKYFIKYVYPPCWVQQLGIFSIEKVENELIQEFIKAIPMKFKKITIQFNSGNFIPLDQFEKRSNFILPLYKPYNELLKDYKYIRRRRLNKLRKDEISIENTNSITDIVQLFKIEKLNSITINDKDYNRLEKLVQHLVSDQNIEICITKNQAKELLGGAIFFKDKKRITYLYSISSEIGRKYNVMTQIIDSVIATYSNSDYILDFEGSMIPSVAYFFKSFGAKNESYYLFRKKLF